eukprot:6110475-Amphidinium_carterae.1
MRAGGVVAPLKAAMFHPSMQQSMDKVATKDIMLCSLFGGGRLTRYSRYCCRGDVRESHEQLCKAMAYDLD